MSDTKVQTPVVNPADEPSIPVYIAETVRFPLFEGKWPHVELNRFSDDNIVIRLIGLPDGTTPANNAKHVQQGDSHTREQTVVPDDAKRGEGLDPTFSTALLNALDQADDWLFDRGYDRGNIERG